MNVVSVDSIDNKRIALFRISNKMENLLFLLLIINMLETHRTS